MEGVERRQVILFADISGSAKLYERLGDAEALRAVDRCIKRMERAVEGFGGRMDKIVGGEIMARFDTADAACQSALEMQHRVADLPPVSGVKLSIRIAFHQGPVTESNGETTGETVDTAARIAGLARAGQILTSAGTAGSLPSLLREGIRDSGQSAGKNGGIPILEVHWQRPEDTVPPSVRPKAAKAADSSPAGGAKPAEVGVPPAPSPRLCLRYRGRAYLLDEKTPILSLGRDTGSDIIIEDRKASRHHARIERRGNRYFFVDRSTNGSYVALGSTQETMVRRAEVLLVGNGSICFGASANDPAADCATFEHL